MIIKGLNAHKSLRIIFFILLAIIIDQCTKIFVSKLMLSNNFEDISIFSFFNIVFVRNTGVSFGLFSEGGSLGRYFFSIFSLTVGLFLILLALFTERFIFACGLCLISAGAIGNAIDRIYFGGVIDFIDIYIYNFHWPAFNFADIYISVGIIMLLFNMLKKTNLSKK